MKRNDDRKRQRRVTVPGTYPQGAVARLNVTCPEGLDHEGTTVRTGTDAEGRPIKYIDVVTPFGAMPVAVPHGTKAGETFEVPYPMRMPGNPLAVTMSRGSEPDAAPSAPARPDALASADKVDIAVPGESKGEGDVPIAACEPGAPFLPDARPPVPADARCNMCGRGPETSEERRKRNPMIRPCRCEGFVHRKCLDNWRATRPNAFTQCQQCKFVYIFESIPQEEEESVQRCRAHKFRALVARDSFVVFVLLQLTICALGALVWAADGAQDFGGGINWWGPDGSYQCEPQSLIDRMGCPRYNNLFYYAWGVCVFLAGLGLVGTFKWCCCKSNGGEGDPCCDCYYYWDGCDCCCGYGNGYGRPLGHRGGHHYAYYHGGGGTGDCCTGCCRNCDCNCCHNIKTNTNCEGCTCCCDGANCNCSGANCDCSGADCKGDAAAVLLIVLAVVFVVLVLVGVLMGFVIASAMIQQILQRHYHVLQKRVLANKWVVEDQNGRFANEGSGPKPNPLASPVSAEAVILPTAALVQADLVKAGCA
jgi:hypothetical protein